MLVEFRVGNFRSFKETQTFSLVASSDKTFLEHTIETDALGKIRLNRSSAVYGANASGKSNLFAAFAFVHQFVADSYKRRPMQGHRIAEHTPIHIAPFLLDPTLAHAPSEFEMIFIHNGVRYQYGFIVDDIRIHGEWLIAYPHGQPQRWFERRLQRSGEYTYDFRSKAFRGEKQLITEVTRPDMLYLSTGTTFASKQLTEVFSWFQRLRFVQPLNRQYAFGSETSRRAWHDPLFHKRVRNLLIYADVGIVDFQVQAIQQLSLFSDAAREVDIQGDSPSSQPTEHYEAFFQHQGVSERYMRLPLVDESRGTQQLYELASVWITALEEGHILVVDELDASMHPLLTRQLIAMFHDPQINRSNAQLIFNTHDVTLLDRTLFRRDQIWFTEKDREGATHLYPLLDFSPRTSESLMRGYLQGRYGAIPFFEQLEDWSVSDAIQEEGVSSAE